MNEINLKELQELARRHQGDLIVSFYVTPDEGILRHWRILDRESMEEQEHRKFYGEDVMHSFWVKLRKEDGMED